MIFVLGGEGFVGSAFVAEARRQGRSCVAITRRNYRRYAGRPCDLLINANGNSKKFLAEKDPALDFKLSVESVLHSLLDFPAKAYVYLSSVAVYPDPSRPDRTREDAAVPPSPDRPYGYHKWLAEQLVRQYARRWIILRLAGMMAPNLKKGPLYDLLRGQKLWTSPESAFQLMETADVARAAYKLIDQKRFGQVFNVAGQGAVPLKDIAAWLGRDVPRRKGLPVERWNASVAKVSRFVRIPSSRSAVQAFLRTTRG